MAEFCLKCLGRDKGTTVHALQMKQSSTSAGSTSLVLARTKAVLRLLAYLAETNFWFLDVTPRTEATPKRCRRDWMRVL